MMHTYADIWARTKGIMFFPCVSFNVPFDDNQPKGSGGWSDPSVSPAEGEINNFLPLWVLGSWKSWLDKRMMVLFVLIETFDTQIQRSSRSRSTLWDLLPPSCDRFQSTFKLRPVQFLRKPVGKHFFPTFSCLTPHIQTRTHLKSVFSLRWSLIMVKRIIGPAHAPLSPSPTQEENASVLSSELGSSKVSSNTKVSFFF